MATVTLRNIHKSFDKVEVIKGIDLDIGDQEFVVFVGPSGCGKSTLLRLIAGLEEITSGDIYIDGERVNDLPADRRGLAMVFQSYALYPHMTVAGNLGFSLRLAGMARPERDSKIMNAARILQLESLLERKPKELSGGQRQRVAIGRAIVRNPKVFLFDEPLSNLDASLRVQMRIEIARLHKDLKATTIYVTHDQVEAMTLADKIVVLREGEIEQVGTPLELYHHPQNIFVAGFIGSPQMNMFRTSIIAIDEAGITVRLPGNGQLRLPVMGGNLKPDEAVTLGVRPEHLRPAPDGQLCGEVVMAERLGDKTYLYLQIESIGLVIIEVRGDNTACAGDRMSLAMNTVNCHLFSSTGEAIGNVPGKV